MAEGGATRNFEKPISIPFPFTRRKEISSVALFEGGGGGAAIWDYGNRADEAGNTCENPKS